MSRTGITCPQCPKTFTRSYDMNRPVGKFHTGENDNNGLTTILHSDVDVPLPNKLIHNPDRPDNPVRSVKLQHPFTMCVSGPTSCGKTQLVKRILKQRMISPNPQRIVWLYKRWQPAYTEMKATVYPQIQFHRGIPDDLEKDEFFNSNVRNMIVLDDLMSTAAKDQRVTDLFTEGSHHRNLSVISLNQNLYFS